MWWESNTLEKSLLDFEASIFEDHMTNGFFYQVAQYRKEVESKDP